LNKFELSNTQNSDPYENAIFLYLFTKKGQPISGQDNKPLKFNRRYYLKPIEYFVSLRYE